MKKIKAIHSKLLFICLVLLILPSSIIGFLSYNLAKSELDKKGEVILKNGVKQAMYLIDAKQKNLENSILSKEEMQEEIRVFLLGKKTADGKRPINKNIDLGENGYFFIFDSEGNKVLHPSTEGKNSWKSVDKSKDKKLFAQEIIKKAKNGGGFTEYTWTFPGSEETGSKITYSEYDPEWDWIVVAGTYHVDFNKGSNRILKILFITLGVAFVLGVIIIIFFAKHISAPIKKIMIALEKVANGELNISPINIKNKDETGKLADAFNNMLINITGLISAVKNSGESVSNAAISLNETTTQSAKATEEISLTIAEISNGATEQAENIFEGANKISELGEDIERVTSISGEMNEVYNGTNELAEEGLKVIKVLGDKSYEATEATNEVNTIISHVNDSSKQIGVITTTIKQIAEQTNLLALNASIEAARAGEAGKGFAVVADEIRKLAEQSSQAIQDINDILSNIQNSSQSAVTSIEHTKEIVYEQNQAVEDTKTIFNNISISIESLKEKVIEVAKYNNRMNDKKAIILGITENLSAISEESAASTQEVSAATEELSASSQEVAKYARDLNDLSNDLFENIKQFKID
ncbi:methyl-accepting chemotaxis protein [Oceanirhabdus sp. W0125-5]|uniref:methyl-accepting chemotaxis protein n=1 Tax=Oceanirhabdus sp. W0125-5 TaxID=2999116 RepID=UPI0022F2B4E6|nr:methyl-accepting chemotaxis protein [Oceanirhabdus sp. W0125-5]WBW97118.1 methyl-accepting chemotaxis protein [Oceanirhabdus sp. W0125-5]